MFRRSADISTGIDTAKLHHTRRFQTSRIQPSARPPNLFAQFDERETVQWTLRLNKKLGWYDAATLIELYAPLLQKKKEEKEEPN